ncbi:MAG: TonB-dependent receptor [Sphingobium sp.]
MIRKSGRGTRRSAMLLALTTVSMAGIASPALAAAQTQKIAFNIPSQRLGTTLNQIGRQSGREILFQAALVEGKRAPALSGRYFVDEALSRALEGSSLTHRLTAQGAYVVEQEAPRASPAATTAAPAAPSPRIADIIVTAQKRAENMQDVPIAITALGGDQLTTRNIQTTEDLTTVAPGFNVRKTSSTFQPYIRGIGTSAGFVENPVSLYVDGVYIPDQRGALLDLIDVEQISILKGPQGTLFGRNSTAGVIQITTRKPSHDFGVKGSVGIDNYATLRSALYVTGGLTDSVAASVSASYTKQWEGYGKNLTTGEDTGLTDHNLSVRGKILIEPSDRTEITLIGEHYHNHLEGENQMPYRGTSYVYPGYSPRPGFYDSWDDTNRLISNWGDAGSLTIHQDLGFGSLTSISSYRKTNGTSIYDVDAVADPLFLVDIQDAPSRNITQELQLSSTDSGPLVWQIGAFYYNNKDAVAPALSYLRPPFTRPPVQQSVMTRSSHQKSESVAAFAQATWEVLPGTKLTGGIRYTYEKREFNGLQTLSNDGGPAMGAPVTGELSFKKPTYRVSLDHRFTDEIMGYVSFNTGFKSGGFNLMAPTTPAFLPEKLTAYEVGIKSELFDRSVRLNMAGFYYDYSNIQVFQVINNVSTVSNAAKAEVYGLDVDLDARLADGLRLSGGLALLHAQYKRYENAQIAEVNPAGGMIISNGDVSGNRLPMSQKFSGNVALDYETSLRDADLHLNVTASYQGDFYFEPDNFQRQDAYVMLNSSARIDLPGKAISVALWGKNLLNEKVQTFGSTNAFSATAMFDSAPRTYGVTLHFRY